MWRYRGRERPDFAIEPGAGQESVWDYPRPPALRPDHREVVVRSGDVLLARTVDSLRVLETASPPTFYVPSVDVRWEHLRADPGRSFCEWKGTARYWALASNPERVVGWSYPQPKARFAALVGAVGFYPGRVACFVDAERARAQAGGFYGGWVTSEVVGPFKGDPGTGSW